MANLGGLPNLGSRRLSILQKQLNSSRKTTTMVNDRLKDGLERFERNVDKQKQSEDIRAWQKAAPMRKSMTEKKALQSCLRRRRWSAASQPESQKSPRNGVYDGIAIRNMASEIKEAITHMTPSYQRTRKVEVLKTVGYRQGRLVDYDDSLIKFDDVLSRPKPPTPRLPALPYTPGYTMLKREHPLDIQDYSPLSSPSSSCDANFQYSDDDTARRRSASLDGRSRRTLPAVRGARRQSHYEKSLPSRQPTSQPQLPKMTRRLSSCGPY